jgi:hypothetical protein
MRVPTFYASEVYSLKYCITTSVRSSTVSEGLLSRASPKYKSVTLAMQARVHTVF